MKFYKLKKDLPTFKAGDLFCLADNGSLWHSTGNEHVDVMAYHRKTLELFPNILTEWFEECEAPKPKHRDENTKKAFIRYLREHPNERFFQSVRNFTNRYINDLVNYVYVTQRINDTNTANHDRLVDTFYWECDNLLKDEEDAK